MRKKTGVIFAEFIFKTVHTTIKIPLSFWRVLFEKEKSVAIPSSDLLGRFGDFVVPSGLKHVNEEEEKV